MTARRGRQPAYTLIEVMIVVAILGLLAAAAVLTFAGPVRTAQAREAVEQIRAADADARRAARSFDRAVTLVIDLGKGKIERREAGQGVTFRTVLPGSIRIDEIRTGAADREFEAASIEYSPLGLSRSFALKVVTSDDDDRFRWLVFAGLSGQMSVVSDEKVGQILPEAR